MREPTLSDSLFNLLGYFANGGIVYSDQYPDHIPYWDLFPVLLSRSLVKEFPIKPNELIYHIENPKRVSYYAISPEGKELYLLEKEIRNERADQDAKICAEHVQAVKDKKQQLRHDFSVAAFSELISAGLPHLQTKAIDFFKALFKS